jgi:hypothetical protein
VGLFEQETIGLLYLAMENLTCGENYFYPVRLLELGEIPAEGGCVPDYLFGGHFEQHDQSRFAVLDSSSINELKAHRGLARSCGSFYKRNVPSRDASREELIESFDTGFYKVLVSHWIATELAAKPPDSELSGGELPEPLRLRLRSVFLGSAPSFRVRNSLFRPS